MLLLFISRQEDFSLHKTLIGPMAARSEYRPRRQSQCMDECPTPWMLKSDCTWNESSFDFPKSVVPGTCSPFFSQLVRDSESPNLKQRLVCRRADVCALYARVRRQQVRLRGSHQRPCRSHIEMHG